MPVTAEQLQAEDTAHDQAAINDSKTKAAQASFDIGERNGATTAEGAHDALKDPPANTLTRWAGNLPQNISTALIDDAVSTADTFHSITGWMDQHRGHIVEDAHNAAVDATSNAMTSASNAVSRGAYAAVGQKAPASTAPAPFEPTLEKPDPVDPVYDHVRDTVMNLRDHLAVQDPNAADEATQSILRVGIPALGWSRFLSGIGVVSKIWNAVGTDALTGGVSQGAHDPRFADMLALGRHTEGKYIDALGTADPTGGLLNHYTNFMTDRSNESEVEGRLKGALDFVLGGAAVAPLFHAIPQVLRQGFDVLAMGMDAGIGKTSDVFTLPSYQRGSFSTRQIGEAPLPADSKIVSPKSADEIPPSDLKLEDENKGQNYPMAAGAPGKDALGADNALTSARSFLKAQTEAGHEGSAHSMITALSQHIDASTPDGAFYKDILGRLSAKNLDTQITQPGSGLHPSIKDAGPNNAGHYSGAEDTMALYPRAFKDNATLVHTVAHEAVHAATVKAIRDTPGVKTALSGLMNEAIQGADALAAKDKYGFKNPKEFVAEAEANPRFQQLLKNTKSADGRPLWDHYKEVIGGIFGITGAAIAAPQFDKLLTKENTGA